MTTIWIFEYADIWIFIIQWLEWEQLSWLIKVVALCAFAFFPFAHLQLPFVHLHFSICAFTIALCAFAFFHLRFYNCHYAFALCFAIMYLQLPFLTNSTIAHSRFHFVPFSLSLFRQVVIILPNSLRMSINWPRISLLKFDSVLSNNVTQYIVSLASLSAILNLCRKSSLLSALCASCTMAPIAVPDLISWLARI